MHSQIDLLDKIELQELLDVKFLNLVLVTKLTRGIHICTYFRDLNKEFPKYYFSLPNINMIVDLTVGNEMLLLMDGFSTYNQIRIVPGDQHKILGNLLLERDALWS